MTAGGSVHAVGEGGATWSEPTQINDVKPQRQWEFSEMDPMLDVAPDGRIDVAWFDSARRPCLYR